jgi:hypothetical protein
VGSPGFAPCTASAVLGRTFAVAESGCNQARLLGSTVNFSVNGPINPLLCAISLIRDIGLRSGCASFFAGIGAAFFVELVALYKEGVLSLCQAP